MGQSLFKKHSKFIISMKYFTTAWPDSGRHYLDVFTQSQDTRNILREENMEQSLFKKSMKYYTVE